MDTQKIQEFKAILEEKKQKIEDQLQEVSKTVDMGDDVDSFDEETDEAVAFTSNAAQAEEFKRSLQRINDAISKIEQDNYGVCENCKKEIELEMLEIDPESRYCRSCKMEVAEPRGF